MSGFIVVFEPADLVKSQLCGPVRSEVLANPIRAIGLANRQDTSCGAWPLATPRDEAALTKTWVVAACPELLDAYPEVPGGFLHSWALGQAVRPFNMRRAIWMAYGVN